MKHKRKQENEFTEENVEKNNEKQGNVYFHKIPEFFKDLKIKSASAFVKLNNSKALVNLKEKWKRKADIHELFLAYRNINLENINKSVDECFDLNLKIFTYTQCFNKTKQEIKLVKTDKIDIDTNEMEEELHKLEQEINRMAQSKKLILKGLSGMEIKRNVIVEIKSGKKQFITDCIRNNSKILIIYILMAFINIVYSLIHFEEFGILGSAMLFALFTYIYFKIVSIIGLRAVRNYVSENENLKNIIRNDYREAIERIASYGQGEENKGACTAV